MKEEFFKLKEYLKNEYLRMSDAKDEILREKVQLEVERDREESPLFSEKDKNQIKRLFSPLSDEAFHSVFQEDKNESKISKKIDELENKVNQYTDSMNEIKEYISFVQSLERDQIKELQSLEIKEERKENVNQDVSADDLKEYTGNDVSDDAKAMITAAISFLESEYPDILFFVDVDENQYIISAEANANLIRIITYTISSTIEAFEVDSVWIEIKRKDNDMLISLQLANNGSLVGHYAYKSALTII